MTGELKGMREFEAVLSALPANIQRNAMGRGLRAGARVIRDEARLRAPKDTGKMAKAIRTGSPRKREDGTFTIRIYVDERKEHGFLGYFIEYGVLPHFISASGVQTGDNARASSRAARRANRRARENGGVLVIGNDFVSGVVEHPGHAAHPFMRPALQNKANEAVAEFAKAVRAYVEDLTGFVQRAA
ncbi:MAG: HK97-gp10 family putative phage morphogenesis protein [Pseudomonadota bacterium]